MYARVIIDISHEMVDRPFTYRVPEHLKEKIHPGCSVLIPFGKGNTSRQGYVIDLEEEASYDPTKIKTIEAICTSDVSAPDKLIALALWMKNTYGSTMISALKTILPVKEKKKQLQVKVIYRACDMLVLKDALAQANAKHQKAKVRILQELLDNETLPYSLVRSKLQVTSQTLQSLERAGVLRVEAIDVYRNPVRYTQGKGVKRELSRAQQNIVDTFLKDYDNGVRKTYLLHGITGSGKTEVYIELIRGCIQRGKQAIVLIPEIALTYQTLMRFYKQFGDRVSVMNSALSQGEKYDQCRRAKEGDIDVIIGPRSALFTPFPNIGLIIIDEEHENSYKSENTPKYHARETAIQLATLHGASVFLGSATPSMESFYHAQKGEYGYFSLTERLTGNTLPAVEITDLREELRKGNRSMFSLRLQELMQDRLSKKQQIMLFINRRGMAGFVSCRACGHVMKCPHCEVSLSEHRGGKLICHYCGYTTTKADKCPECGSPYIMGFKAGTEAVELGLHKMFPTARVLRMDADTTRTKDSYEEILSTFKEGEADILLGTQMIVKGHDFPGVTLVGILAADLSLFQGDYRSSERTFQLLTQAAGRAGRGEEAGEVIIQTYQPDHYALVHAKNQDYEGFYREELLYRELGHYPPAGHLMAVLVTSSRKERAEKIATVMANGLRESVSDDKTIQVIGPSPASVSKIQDIFRFVFYLKGKDSIDLVKAKEKCENYLERLHATDLQVQFDMDPMTYY